MADRKDKHARVTELFAEVCELPASERRRVLEIECGDDVSLRQEVESLVDRDAAGELFLETPALGKNFELGDALTDDDDTRTARWSAGPSAISCRPLATEGFSRPRDRTAFLIAPGGCARVARVSNVGGG